LRHRIPKQKLNAHQCPCALSTSAEEPLKGREADLLEKKAAKDTEPTAKQRHIQALFPHLHEDECAFVNPAID